MTRVVVTELATDYCVKATALDGISEGFKVVLLTGAVRSVDLTGGDGAAALQEVEAAGGLLV